MNQLKIFENAAFGEIRVVEKGGEPWFVAAEICKILGLENVSRALDSLDVDEKSVLQSLTNRKVNNDFNELRNSTRIISESGLYALIFKSQKNEARTFRKWITSEVLPTIRKTGSYGLAQVTREDAILAAAKAIEEQRRLEAVTARQQDTIRAQYDYMDKTRALAEIRKSFERKTSCMEIAKAAREISLIVKPFRIGEKTLFKWLRKNGWLCKSKKYWNQPTQLAQNRGFILPDKRRCPVCKGSDRMQEYTVPVITNRGFSFFLQTFRNCLLHY